MYMYKMYNVYIMYMYRVLPRKSLMRGGRFYIVRVYNSRRVHVDVPPHARSPGAGLARMRMRVYYNELALHVWRRRIIAQCCAAHTRSKENPDVYQIPFK